MQSDADHSAPMESHVEPTAAAVAAGAGNGLSTPLAGESTGDGHSAARVARWLVGRPILSIGGADSGPGGDLSRIVGTVRYPDGRIAVADGAQRVLLFDAGGAHLRTLGGRGSGPGEFQSIGWLQLAAGDTLLVFDPATRRVSEFGGSGELVGTMTAGRQLVGRLEDGRYVAREDAVLERPSGAGIVRPEVSLLLLDGEGEILERLGTVPGDEILQAEDHTFHSGGLLRRLRLAVGGSVVYAAAGDRFEVTAFRPGASERRMARDYAPRPIESTDHSTALGRRLASLPPAARPTTRPATGAVLVDPAGRIWVEEFAYGTAGPVEWTVFSPTGEHLALTTMPDRFQPYQVGEDFLLGVWRDDLGVEHVRMYTLQRRSAG